MNKWARAVFLDRDGTLIADKGYISRPAQVELLPDVPPALAILRGLGFELIVISNQSGVGRGLMTAQDVDRVNRRLHELLSARGCVDGLLLLPAQPGGTVRLPEAATGPALCGDEGLWDRRRTVLFCR